MLRAAKKKLVDPFKLTYLGYVEVSLQASLGTEFFGPSLDESIDGYEALLICGQDYNVGYIQEIKMIANEDNILYMFSTDVKLVPLPRNKKGIMVTAYILTTGANDDGFADVSFNVHLRDKEIVASLVKRSPGNISTDNSKNMIVVYGLGEKKLSFFLANSSLFKLKGGELSLLRETHRSLKLYSFNSVTVGPPTDLYTGVEIWDNVVNRVIFKFKPIKLRYPKIIQFIEITMNAYYSYEQIETTYKIGIETIGPELHDDGSIKRDGMMIVKMLDEVGIEPRFWFSFSKVTFNTIDNSIYIYFDYHGRRSNFYFNVESFDNILIPSIDKFELDKSIYKLNSNIHKDGTNTKIMADYIGLPNTQRQKKPRVNKQYFTSFSHKIGGGVNVA